MDKASLLLLDLVLEGCKLGLKVFPHGLDFAEVHGLTLQALDHHILRLDAFVDPNDALSLDAELDGI